MPKIGLFFFKANLAIFNSKLVLVLSRHETALFFFHHITKELVKILWLLVKFGNL